VEGSLGSAADGKLILIVDDDHELGEMLAVALEDEGYRVALATSGREGLRQFYALKPALVVLDIMMPHLDGWEVCRRIRELSDTPILVLSARVAEDDVTRGLYLGADDYVTKPFHISEFLARVKAVLRRSGEAQDAHTHAVLMVNGHLTIDFQKRRVIVDGRPVSTLSPIELKLLSVLAAHSGEVVPSEVLIERVWGDVKSRNEGHLKTYIHYLRKKIEKDPKSPKYILTERGLGYRFLRSTS